MERKTEPTEIFKPWKKHTTAAERKSLPWARKAHIWCLCCDDRFRRSVVKCPSHFFQLEGGITSCTLMLSYAMQRPRFLFDTVRCQLGTGGTSRIGWYRYTASAQKPRPTWNHFIASAEPRLRYGSIGRNVRCSLMILAPPSFRLCARPISWYYRLIFSCRWVVGGQKSVQPRQKRVG